MSGAPHEGKHEPQVDPIVYRYEKGLSLKDLPFFEPGEFETIIAHYDGHGYLEKALEASEFASEQHPFTTEFLIRKAQLLGDLERFEEAMLALDKAEIFDSMDIDVKILRAELFCAQGLYLKAVEVLKEAIAEAQMEEKEELFIELSDVYERSEKFGHAFYYLKEALKINPTNAEVLARICFCVDLCDKFDESIRLHKDLIDRFPYLEMAWYNLGQAYRGLDRLEEAVEAFEYAVAINENYYSAIRAIADTYFRMGDYKEALYYFKTLAGTEKGHKEIYFKVGICHYQLQEYMEARHYFKLCLKGDPSFAEAHYYAGVCLQEEGRYRSALKRFSKAASLKPCSEYLEAVANAFLELGMFQDAFGFYTKAMSFNKQSVEILLKMIYSLSQYETQEEFNVSLGKFWEESSHPEQRRMLFWLKQASNQKPIEEDPLVLEQFAKSPLILDWVKMIFPLHRGIQQIQISGGK